MRITDEKVSETEKKWKRQEDARTLARAEEIKADKGRYQAAKLGAREILKEELEMTKGLMRVVKSPNIRNRVNSTSMRVSNGRKSAVSSIYNFPDCFKPKQ